MVHVAHFCFPLSQSLNLLHIHLTLHLGNLPEPTWAPFMYDSVLDPALPSTPTSGTRMLHSYPAPYDLQKIHTQDIQILWIFFFYWEVKIILPSQARWLTPVILALWEAEAGRSSEVGGSRPAWPTWRNPVSTKNTKLAGCGGICL